MMDLSFLPHVNATLNGLATVLLVTGFVMIRRKSVGAHKACMLSAFGVSVLFLVLYVAHKLWKASSGTGLHTTFNYSGAIQTLYLVILFTHLVLAMVVPVIAIWLIRLAVTERFARHRRVARVGFPVWLYVSVTGVLIYMMLYHWNAPLPQ
jgi:uncharacterized membrane protein YozB (DUF420 family)